MRAEQHQRKNPEAVVGTGSLDGSELRLDGDLQYQVRLTAVLSG